MCKVAGHVELLLDLEVAEILATAVTCERLPELIRQHRESLDHHTIRFFDCSVPHLSQKHDTGDPFVDAFQSFGAFPRHHRVVFPVADLFSSVDDCGPVLNGGQWHVVQLLCRSEALFLASLVATGEIYAQIRFNGNNWWIEARVFTIPNTHGSL